MNRRDYCIVCGAKLLDKPLMVCRNMPAEAQNLPGRNDLDNEKAVDFNLCQCSGCGLVQFDCEPVSYYLDSTRAGERCQGLIELRQKQYTHLIETYHLQRKKIVEIGAGKGGFLKTLKEMTEYEIQEYGIEYNEEFVRIAREEEGVNVVQGNPEDESIRMEGAPFDAFVTFAYPARLIHPNQMMRLAYNNLKDGGVGFVQVASLEHLIREGGYYDITRDHIAYYDKRTLRFLCEKNGFDVLEEGEAIDTYIYAVVKKRLPVDVSSLTRDAEVISESVKQFIYEKVSGRKKIAVWCAGHYAFTVLSVTGISNEIKYIVDNAPFKQGYYSPASHIPIVSPSHFKDEPVDVILILGPIYVDEIVNEIRDRCSKEVGIAVLDRNGIREIS
ncbi:MAG: methyltransferase domain-containing protein [Roseburia sp.]|jgi:hypothetical protein|nr:methyltransferase domain-containing protein [Roseburia sp.]